MIAETESVECEMTGPNFHSTDFHRTKVTVGLLLEVCSLIISLSTPDVRTSLLGCLEDDVNTSAGRFLAVLRATRAARACLSVPVRAVRRSARARVSAVGVK
eukprot:2938540-Prymnesium_polylepis.1